jgi:hypothetical protein
MWLLVLWVVFAVMVGAAAAQRGRSGLGWFLLAVFISPLLAGILLAIFPDLRTRELLQGIRNARTVDDRELKRNVRLASSDPRATERKQPFDRQKWEALTKYDPEIAAIANKLNQLGQKWVDEFARAYLALNDKQYLPNIVQKLIADARAEVALVEQKKAVNEERQRRHRLSRLWGAALAVCLIVTVSAVIYFKTVLEDAHRQAELQALRNTNVAAYLQELKRSNDPRYESEFAALDNEGYRSYVAEMEAAKRRALAEAEVAERRAATESRAREQRVRSDRIAKLRGDLKSIASSDLDGLQRIYTELLELEPNSVEFKKMLDGLSAQKTQIAGCRSDWAKCADNEQLANSYSQWTKAQVACKFEANAQAKYGTPTWPWLPFGRFYKGKDYVSSGRAVLIEPDAQFQNGFGAMVHSEVTCAYDLRAQRVIDVSISAR